MKKRELNKLTKDQVMKNIDKFKKMIDENPNLERLRNKLGLDSDY